MPIFQDIAQFFSRKSAPKKMPPTNLYHGSWYDFLEMIFSTNQNSAGVTLDERTVLTVPAVYACNKILADTISTLPIGLYQKVGNTIREVNDELDYLVAAQPSSLYNSTDFRSTGQLHLGLDGNFYAQIVRNKQTGLPENLIILNPRQTEPFLHDGKIWYEVKANSNTYILAQDDVLHVRNLSSDGIVGKSPIKAAADAIGVAVSGGSYAGKLLKNGARINSLIKSPGKLTDDQVDAIRKNFKDQYVGPDNAGNIPILQNGLELQAINLSPQEAKIIELFGWTREDIARVYGVPLHMIGDLKQSTNNNIEHQGISWVTNTIRPTCKRWEAELDAKLLGPERIKKGYFYRFNLDALMRGDANARSTFYLRMFQVGALSQNDIRRLENLNPITGGDEYYVQVNMAPTGDNPNLNTNSNDDEGTASPGASAAA